MKNNILYFQDFIDSNKDVLIQSVDNYSLTHYDQTPREHKDQSITNIQAGTWLKYNTTIPAGQFTNCMLFASTQTDNQRIQIHIGSMDNPAQWNFPANTCDVVNFFTETVSGMQTCDQNTPVDIYFSFPDGFNGYLNWFTFSQYSGTETHEAKLKRMKWFTDARFGHMVHWGAYSVLGRGEWVMNNEHIPKDQYITEACIPFDPQSYDAENWAYIIENAGQKYLTITTKHHDGFAMFDTNVTDFAPYDVENTASIHYSVLRPLADACRARGIQFCCYYSLLDWANVNEVAIESGAAQVPPSINPADITRYLSEMKEHLKELIEIFDPALIWFDGAWAGFIQNNKDCSSNIREFLHRLSPDIIINDRIGNSEGDYTTPEKSIPAGSQSSLWESCMTINDSWGYNSTDENWKSTKTLLNDLLDCASKGGNFLLNTGPDGDGNIPEACTSRLSEIGKWMQTWGAAVYNTRAGTLYVDAQPGVYCTVDENNRALITVTQISADKTLRIDLPLTLPAKAYWLNKPEESVDYHTTDGFLTFSLPDELPDELGIVLALEFDNLPQSKVYPDMALLCLAETNSIYHNDPSYGPDKAVDGDPSTRWASEGTENVSLTLNLQRDVTFNRVTFTQFDRRINQFTIDIYSNDVKVSSLSGENPPVSYIGTFDSKISGNKIVLTIATLLESDSPASLYNFSVSDTATDLLPVFVPVNLAKGSVASTSSVWYDAVEHQAVNAVDGNPNTRWAASDNPELPVWFEIDFIKKETFDCIRVNEYFDAKTEETRIKAFTLQLLNEDGVTWNDIYQGTDIQVPVYLPYLTQSSAIRFVITELTGSSGPSFNEVTVVQNARQNTTLDQDTLLETEARMSFEYLWREANTTPGSKGYGLVCSATWYPRRASIACSGFALSGLAIAVERGWISLEVARERCEKSLDALLNYVPHYKGFYYHFVDMDSADNSGTFDTLESEISTVDTMLALNGILTAGQYFGGNCASLAQQIFDRVEWNSAVASDGNFTMGWHDDFTPINATWAGYAEHFCMYPLAAGSTTFAPTDAAAMFYQLQREHGQYGNSGDVIYVGDGSLFTYQFSHAWLDFRRLLDRQGADWWQNSVNATRANREFCIANHGVLPSLDASNWGITACNGPSSTTTGQSEYNAYGTPPSGSNGANNGHYTDGTLTPSGPLGSLPFMPTEALDAMVKWYQNPRLWTGYGFTDSFNTSTAAPWYCPFTSGLIKGLTLLMIENYRSGFVWNTYMSHPVIKTGTQKIFDQQKPETIFQESTPSFTYSDSGWWLGQDRENSTDGNSMVCSPDSSWFEFTFTGESVSCYCEKSPDQGDIDFYIDEQFQGTASAFSEQHLMSDIIFSVTALPPVEHVLKGVKRSGEWIIIDACKTYTNNSFEALISNITSTDNVVTVELSLTQAADRESATNLSSYLINNGAAITEVSLNLDKHIVKLTISSTIPGETYTLNTNNVANEILNEKLNKRSLSFICGTSVRSVK